MPIFPDTLPVKLLQATNPDAQAKYTSILQAYYLGGETFDAVAKDDEIIKRALEEKGGSGCMNGANHYSQRRKRAQYIPRAGGIVGWTVASTTKENPTIEVVGGTDEQVARYEGWNTDADGTGTPFSSLVAQAMEDELTSKRGYFEVKVIDGVPYLDRIEALTMLDWCEDWYKAEFMSWVRPADNDLAPANIELHQWYYWTDTDTVIYEARKSDQGWLDDKGNVISVDQATAYRNDEKSIEGHSFGSSPIFDVRATRAHWVMDRIREPLKALFNAEIDLAFALAQAAYEQPTLTVQDKKRAGEIVRDDASVFVLLEGEKYELIGPSGKGLDALFRNVDRLKLALHESMQMMAKEAAALPQAGRLSGEAVRELRTPMEALLLSLTWPVRDALQRAIDAVKAYYNEPDLDVRIMNFGNDVYADEGELESIIVGGEGNGGSLQGSATGDGGEDRGEGNESDSDT